MTDFIQILAVDPTDPRAEAASAAYIAELVRRFASGFSPTPYGPAELAELRPPLGTFLVALRDGKVLGCVALRPEGPGMGEVKRLWVSPDARGLGLGQRLMTAIEDHARSLGHTRLRLDTNGALTEALSFYHSRGWTGIPRYNDNPYAEAWFEKPL